MYLSVTDKTKLFGVNCNISLVGYIFLLCPIHTKKKHMDTFEKLRMVRERYMYGHCCKEQRGCGA